MKTQTSALLLLVVITFAYSCDRSECQNTNPVFEEFTPDTREYKNELVKEMKRIGPDHLGYWFNSYKEDNGKEYIIVNIQGEGLCAKGEIQVKEWGRLEAIRKTKGGGYRGAELLDLEIEVEQHPTATDLIFKKVDGIID